ncbi:Metallo-dependent phosphatase-like protein [Crepidotus variabilis]|uniref:Metallo-dependent phosphatase-like protein n=1 Tax=Crepidotus variabilis TaxID=179855 RepID=A0A9P6JVC1_9AGAR|nr:Metallo-dependent phosphatase-like protein [Crepidotus variabilis]
MRHSRETFIGLLSVCFFVIVCYSAVGAWQDSSTIQEGFKLLFTEEGQGIRSVPTLPDFTKYKQLRTLAKDEFPLDDDNRKVIIIGDIHGMIGPFRKLLRKVGYQTGHDVLIHTGDIVTRGSMKGSMKILDFLATHNITGVRGNNDQQVVEWRGWFDWILAMPGGLRWLERLESKWEGIQEDEPSTDLDDFLDFERQNSSGQDRKWWQTIPKKWKPLSDHYLVARGMSARHAHYLLNLPLRLHVPHAHTFIVHAGLLPFNPKWAMDDDRQPLAHTPTLFGSRKVKQSKEQLRLRQELSILDDIPQNRDPWTPLNLRSIIKGKMSRDASKGKYWVQLWKRQMKSCVGFSSSLDGPVSETSDIEGDSPSSEFTIQARGQKPTYKLPCYPSTVIYGHTASKGRDINRWSFGLDAGCAYGRRLSALIIGGNSTQVMEIDDDEAQDEAREDENEDDEDDEFIETDKKPPSIPVFRFGDRSRARMISVRC